MKTFAIATALISLTAAATPTFANTVEARTGTVSAAGLDLGTAKGQEMLDARIDRVARNVCGMDDIRTGTRIPSMEARQCYKKAKASAKRQVAALIADQRLGG